MAHEHAFSIGLPDNIVYCDELLDTLQSKVDKSVDTLAVLFGKKKKSFG